jgi:hypothetical protein
MITRLRSTLTTPEIRHLIARLLPRADTDCTLHLGLVTMATATPSRRSGRTPKNPQIYATVVLTQEEQRLTKAIRVA